MSLPRTRRRKPRKYGSIRNDELSPMELFEYRQTGMVRAKEPIVFSQDRTEWPYGCYRRINIKEILGGEELSTWSPDIELEIIARVIMTEYGVIGFEDQGMRYLLDVADKRFRRNVLRDLEWNGCDARIIPGGFISVRRERLIYD